MYTRARKILALVVQNTAPELENTLPKHDLKKHDNNKNKPNHELQNQNCSSVEIEEDGDMDDKMITESVNYLDKTDELTIADQIKNCLPVEIKSEMTMESVDSFDKTNEAAITKSHTKHTPHNKSLVPYYDSDLTLSDNDDNPTQRITSETENKNEEHHTRQSTSSSSTSSSSSASSSSSSSSSDSDISQFTYQANNRSLITKCVTVEETDTDDVIENTPPQQQSLENKRNELNCPPRALKKKQNYYTSPVHTDESDIDLSDTDPTFTSTEPIRKRNNFFDQSSSSSTSSLNSRRPAPNKGRKRTKNSSLWKQNKIKRMRNKGNLIRVCKTFYKATLDISDRMIFTVQNKMNENDFSLNDMRGKHHSHRKINPGLRTAIMEHINSIPKIESHYLRASTSKEYIEGSKTIKDLYNDFKVKQQQDNSDAGTYITYYKIFTTEFNLAFFQPKKDQCDLCNSYYNSNAVQKQDLEDKYHTHIEEKKYSRVEKLNDRQGVNKNVRVAIYDLEAVLQCPKGDTSSFYYKSKLNCYNLTITELTPKESKAAYKNVHCYFWTERYAKRGAIEIGSCVWAYLNALSDEDDDEKEVIFYSDNCCGQNKNKYITSLYLYAVQTLKIKSIMHKFLIRGHTQNEADSIHSLIEKEVKKNLKSGPIYTPDQYIALIKNAKKSKPPLIVHEMNFESFYDLKILQEELGYNYTTNSDGQSVNWNEIKVLKITKENQTCFFYKTSYKDENFKEVIVRNKRKKMKATTEITLQAAYFNKQELSSNKKKDLQELISKALIPSYYAEFYNSLF